MNVEKKVAPQLKNRSFGLIFAGIFCLISVLPMIKGGSYREWALIVAGVFTVVSLVFPSLLQPLNNFWSLFGAMMHKVINPLLMGLIFFVAVVPTGLIMKLFGKDPMKRKFDSKLGSYWVEREESSLTKESFDNQF